MQWSEPRRVAREKSERRARLKKSRWKVLEVMGVQVEVLAPVLVPCHCPSPSRQ